MNTCPITHFKQCLNDLKTTSTTTTTTAVTVMTKKSNVGALKLKGNLISQSGDDIECKCMKHTKLANEKSMNDLWAMAIKCITRLFIAAVLLLFRFAANHVKHVPVYVCVHAHIMFICELVVSFLHHTEPLCLPSKPSPVGFGPFLSLRYCHFVGFYFFFLHRSLHRFSI